MVKGCTSSVDLNPQSSNGQPGLGEAGPPVRLSGTVWAYIPDPRKYGPTPPSPLGDVEVQLFSGKLPSLEPTGAPPLTTTTGSDGTFGFNVTADAEGIVFYQARYGGAPTRDAKCFDGIAGSSSAVAWVNWCPQGATPTTLTLNPVYGVTVTTGSGGAQMTHGLLKGQLTDPTGSGVSSGPIMFMANYYEVTLESGGLEGSNDCIESRPQYRYVATSPTTVWTDENGEFKDVQVELCSITTSGSPPYLVTTSKTSCDNIQAYFGGAGTIGGSIRRYCCTVSNGVSGIVVSC